MRLPKEVLGDVLESRDLRLPYSAGKEKGEYATKVKKIEENQRQFSQQLKELAAHQRYQRARLNDVETRHRVGTSAVVRKETIECVVDKIEEDWAFVVVMVNGREEERMMSMALLSRAGILYEGQPFQIEVAEIKTSEGLDSNRHIRPVGDPSQRHIECVRPDLDLGKFRKKTEQD